VSETEKLQLSDLGEESPSLLRRPPGAISILGISDVITAMGDPPNWLRAARVFSLDVRSTAWLRLWCILRTAAIELQESITEATPHIDRKDRVHDTVDAKIGDGRVAAVTAAELRTGNGGHGAEDI
jgi:hypothetical protein